ncbi:MAG TPA: hypothetical protein VKV26_16020 [Dehalococcoidia bacterium]|nr:hypothetical protein [Dehalococcoidia bacterium]
MNFYDVECRQLEHQLLIARMSRELTASEIETGRLKNRPLVRLPARLRSLRLPRAVRGLPLVGRLA